MAFYFKRKFKHKPYSTSILIAFLLFTCSVDYAQTIANTGSQGHVVSYNWSRIIQIDIGRTKDARKYKAIEYILNDMAADKAGREIFERITKNNDGVLKIKDKEDVVGTYTNENDDGMFSSDYGVKVIRRDMTYDPIDNDLVINFTKSGVMLSFDEETHQFFKISLNSIIATELERASFERTAVEKNCRLLIAKMNEAESFLFYNYKDLMGETFSSDDVAHCRGKVISIYSLKNKANEKYTFTDVVTNALKEYRNYTEWVTKNAYRLETRETPLAQKYTDKFGEPHRSKEPVYVVRLGENRYRSLQFGNETGTDYILLGAGQHYVYKNLSVFYDDKNKQKLDIPTTLTRIKEEYTAQLKYDVEARNSPKMLAYVDRLKKNCNKDHVAATDYQAVMNSAWQQLMERNPYLAGANDVILTETLRVQEKKKKN